MTNDKSIAERERKIQLGTARVNAFKLLIYRAALSMAAKRYPQLAQQAGVIELPAEMGENEVSEG